MIIDAEKLKEIKAQLEDMNSMELMRRYDLLRNFVKKGKEDIAKGRLFLGLDAREDYDLRKITEIMDARNKVIEIYRKEIITRMNEE